MKRILTEKKRTLLLLLLAWSMAFLLILNGKCLQMILHYYWDRDLVNNRSDKLSIRSSKILYVDRCPEPAALLLSPCDMRFDFIH